MKTQGLAGWTRGSREGSWLGQTLEGQCSRRPAATYDVLLVRRECRRIVVGSWGQAKRGPAQSVQRRRAP